MKSNYHTHTKYCNHGDMNVEELIQGHIDANYTNLGVSEHAPMSWGKDNWRLNTIEEVESYIQELKEAREKYKDQIKIFIGLEVEYLFDNQKQLQWAKELRQKVDYLVLANHVVGDVESNCSVHFGTKHNDKKCLDMSLDLIRQGWESGLFAFVAHPDALLNGYLSWDQNCIDFAHQVGAWAQESKAILEINANGLRKNTRSDEDGKYAYTNLNFWKIVSEYDVNVIVNGDTHYKAEIDDAAEHFAYQVAKFGKLNLVELF